MDPYGPALTGSMLARTRDRRESLSTARRGSEHPLCCIPRPYPSSKLASCRASSSLGQLALKHGGAVAEAAWLHLARAQSPAHPDDTRFPRREAAGTKERG